MNFYFIAINYNGFNFTRDYINSVKNITVENDDIVEVIIVDNNSSFDDYESLRIFCTGFEFVRLIRVDENLGYFKGLNKGILEAKESRGDMLIIGNNDLTFDKEFLLNLKKIDYDNDVLVIAPNITTKDGRQQNPHVIEKVSLSNKIKAKIYYSNYYVGQALKMINGFVKDKLYSDKKTYNNFGQMKIKRGIGACYILTPNFFSYFGMLDDCLFLWGEEVMLSRQLESVSGSTLYDPTLKIIHHESASVNKIEAKSRYDINKASYNIYKKYL